MRLRAGWAISSSITVSNSMACRSTTKPRRSRNRMTDARTPKRLFIETYGCQMNVYDSERMRDVLQPLGYAVTEKPDDADLVILNTCHIREKATEKVYSEIGRLRAHKERRAEIGRASCRERV